VTGTPGLRPTPILMYHQVTPAPEASFAKYTVTARAFAAQMQWLALAGYTPVTLERLLDGWSGRGALPARSVVITFDDGYRDCIDFAVPALLRHGFTAVFYLVAGLVGQSSRWTLPICGVAFPLMDWTAARSLGEAGMECGAHTMTHPPLAERPATEWHQELVESRQLLEQRLGREVRHLAYPFGSVDASVRAAAEESGYVSACTTEKGLAMFGDDRLMLRRVPVYGNDSLLDFICRLRTAETARQVFRRTIPPRAFSLYRKLRGGTP
jgi:peptidoglycan/xylan/chitin deacetylase (PgdA/CDA1 family)